MHGPAVLAVKQAAIASAGGIGLLPGLVTGIAGFAIGIVVSVTCLLLVASNRRKLRRNTAARTRFAVETWTRASDPLDESAEKVVSVDAGPLAAAIAQAMQARHGGADGGARDSRDVLRTGLNGLHNTHKSPGPGAGDWRRTSKRSTARHAAPAAGFGHRLGATIPVDPVAVRD